MNSFISNSNTFLTGSIGRALRTFSPWFAALLSLIVVELFVAVYHRPLVADRSNFLMLAPLRNDSIQRLIIHHKLNAWSGGNFEIMQVGDSSGFYGIRSRVVEEYLPENMNFVNFSCCANLGYRGYYALLDYFSSTNKNLKYFVLYVSPTGLPRDYLWYDMGVRLGGNEELRVFGHDVASNFTGLRGNMGIPSLGLRYNLSQALFFPYLAERQSLTKNKNFEEFKVSFLETGGWWQPRNEAVKLGQYASAPECKFPDQSVFEPLRLGYVSIIEHVFSEIAELAKKRDIKLVIAFHPVPCKLGTGVWTADAQAALKRFRIKYPEVIVPFSITEQWPIEMFTVPAHVNWEGTFETSHRLGRALRDKVFAEP